MATQVHLVVWTLEISRWWAGSYSFNTSKKTPERAYLPVVGDTSRYSELQIHAAVETTASHGISGPSLPANVSDRNAYVQEGV